MKGMTPSWGGEFDHDHNMIVLSTIESLEGRWSSILLSMKSQERGPISFFPG
jgi:hypothetical protein